ncbi:MAG TPA: NTP transferase domain-containing protein, partial [Roseiarcus sp.]|nr:NTP transferase domain-containing protein [Roseiarcus sp.]
MSFDARRRLAIVLAAGEGVRMRSSRPKVLHAVAGRPMIAYALAAAREAGAADIVVVVGADREDVAEIARRNAPGVEVVIQRERKGTAHAVLAAREAIARGYDDILVVYGDCPLIRGATLKALCDGLAQGADLVALGFRPADPSGYGRLIERDGRLVAIREHKDASEAEQAARLCNAGPVAFRGISALEMLEAVKPHNAQREYYLTDLVEIAAARGLIARAVEAEAEEAMGVNDRVQLAAAERAMQARLRRRAMVEGATLIAPETIFLSFDTAIGR